MHASSNDLRTTTTGAAHRLGLGFLSNLDQVVTFSRETLSESWMSDESSKARKSKDGVSYSTRVDVGGREIGGASASLPSLSLSLSLPWIMSLASNGSDEARTLRADANFKRKVRESDREREAIGREGRMGEGGAETEKERELCLCYYAIICVCMGSFVPVFCMRAKAKCAHL